MTREEFIKQRCEIDKITEEEFEEQYRVVECNCGQPYCKGYKCLDLDDLLKENQELKKQLEKWEHHLKCSKEMLDIQAQKGNYDYDEYMLGLYNGMEYIISLFETREPNFISGKDIEFINDKSQQKEFINYLEDEIKLYENDILNFSKDYNVYFSLINDLRVSKAKIGDILKKYKSIIGVSDENKTTI